MDKATKADKPFFVWWNSTRMHVFTHLKKDVSARPAWASMPTAWSSTTRMVGQLLDKLKELGIEDNTIVMYSTDNGAESFTWPDGGTTMFRGEKNTQWEGGYRVPAADPLARRHQARHRSSTTSARTRTCSRRCWRRRATPPSRKIC